jgi:hypothetical protein
MALTSALPINEHERGHALAVARIDEPRSSGSAVSWGAVIAGAVAAAALSLILLILGVGLGMSSVSPWHSDGISAATFGVSTIVWLTVTQFLSASMGGYLAGRLRTKWMDAHTDEVYFRDTAHGFLAWAVATLATASLLTSVIGSILGSGLQAGASVAGNIAGGATAAVGGAGAAAGGMAAERGNGVMGYFVDSLFRPEPSPAPAPLTLPGAADNTGNVTMPAEPTAAERTANTSGRASPQETAEVARIFMNVSRSAPLPPEDVRYVGQIVSRHTGLSQQAAEKRVTDVYANAQAKFREAEVAAREAADKARKATAYASLWLFVSLLIGAFMASLAATYGGRQRDA